MPYGQASIVSGDLVERLRGCYSGAVYDVLRKLGIGDTVLPHDIKPLQTETRLAGRIFTASGRRQDGADEHDSLLTWTRLLSVTPPDNVLVCQPNDGQLAHMGELSAETLQARGVRGYVVDGGCRDADFILRAGFPVFCRYTTPADIVGRWLATDFGDPITIGAVHIATGDLILGDRDGIVVVPAEAAEEVVTNAEALMGTESDLRKAIRAGMDPQEAYLKFGVF